LAHQRLKAGKHSHALLELQLWRYQDGHFINRRSGLALAVDSSKCYLLLFMLIQLVLDTRSKLIFFCLLFSREQR
jgi:hypothetical protein